MVPTVIKELILNTPRVLLDVCNKYLLGVAGSRHAPVFVRLSVDKNVVHFGP